MDDGWVGRRLMLASRALAERYGEHEEAAGAAGPLVGSVAASLLREIGRCIALSEEDARLAFARARGVLRLPPTATDPALAQAFNALTQLVLDYLRHLPGATDAQLRLARTAVGHAARSTMYLQRLLAAGLRDREAERLFGGVAVLVFHPADEPLSPGIAG